MSSTLDEARRLRVLLDLNILDTATEERFDRITRMAARLFNVPMAFVSLVDANRLWFKSQVGFPFSETPSDKSFCTHAIRQDEMMVVQDAMSDPRFAASHYVTGFPQVRFYAGLPIAHNGAYIGTFCLIDSLPREFGEADRVILRDLAAMVANEVAAGALAEAQAAQRRSEASLRALLEHLPDSVLLLDDAGAVVSCNPATERLFGRAAAELSGQPAAALLGVDDSRLAPAPGTQLRFETRLARPGATIDVEVALSAVEIDGLPHRVASLHDVTAHRAALEAERGAEQRRLAYFRTATHELRTPMASILGFSELLTKRDYERDMARELLDIIHKQSTRLLSLINQMLDLARLEAGGPDEAIRAAVSPVALATAAIEETVPAARKGDVTLDCGSAVPFISVNPGRIQQALGHVLDNAVHYSTPGTPVAVVVAPAARDGRRGVGVTVRDQGIGMTPEQQARMFDAFYRAGERSDVEGHGLGLRLVKEILDIHGGAADVMSQRGAGATVTLWLPAGDAL
ncbi:ATP-binding protein [Massilia sp. G4R7]|uniref:histidine kinase n=1 Tax=Massilia phyllostachyos TaxID=2898585 RepID=A0ABS8QBF0_9BURK|nr:ATP-binding protein [Massilia phyllostachyos]MCD2519066.1 ATP-binding protein [Massilia phyllostachyos]